MQTNQVEISQVETDRVELDRVERRQISPAVGHHQRRRLRGLLGAQVVAALAAAALGAPLAGQSVAAAAAPITPSAAVPGALAVEGRVVAADGTPLAGAEVTLRGVPEPGVWARELLAGRDPEVLLVTARQVSDREGHYRITAPGPGIWRVRVAAAGQLALETELAALVEAIVLPPARLEPAAPRSLRISTPAGEPAAGGWLAVAARRRPASTPAEERWQPAVLVRRADERGDVRVSVPAAIASASAWAPGWLPAAWEAARAGAELPATLTLHAGTPVAVDVRTPAGGPAADAVALALAGALGPLGRSGTSLFGWPLGATDADGRLAVPAASRVDQPVRFLARDGASVVWNPSLPEGFGVSGGVSGVSGGASSPTIAGAQFVELTAPLRVLGRVLRQPDRQPIGGAVVWAISAPWTVAVTRNDGGFELALPAGESVLIAQVLGHQPASERILVPGDALPPSPLLLLEPAVGLHGRVIDEAGSGVFRATVTLQESGRFGRPRSWGGWSSETGADGGFALPGLPPGLDGALEVRHPGYALHREALITPEPGTVAPAILVRLGSGTTVLGRLIAGSGVPVARGLVKLALASDTGRPGSAALWRGVDKREATSGEDGTFTFERVGQGRFQLEVTAPGWAAYQLAAFEVATGDLPTNQEGGATVDLGDLVMVPGVTVEGMVVDARDQAVAGAKLRVSRVTPTGSAVALDELESAADGSFRLLDLTADTLHQLAVEAAGFSARQVAVTPPEGGSRELLRVVLQRASALRGRVVDPQGEGVAGALVFLGDAGPGAGPSRGFGGVNRRPPTRSEAGGRFSFVDARPGEVEIWAEAPGFVSTAERNLELREGEEVEDVVLTLRRGITLAGRVVDGGGRPLDQVTVTIDADRQRGNQATTDGDGRYALGPVPAGTYTVTARRADLRRETREVELAGAEMALDFVLEPGLELSGRVVDAEAQPVAGARVSVSGSGRWDEQISGASGEFRIQGLAPGGYRLRASTDDRGAGEVGPIEIGTTSASGIEIRLAATQALSGRIVGVAAERLGEVRVDASGDLDRRMGVVASDGGYRIDGLVPGVWQVRARLALRAVEQRLEVGDGPPTPLDLVFGTGVRFAGVVLEDGAPLAGAIVSAGGRDVAKEARSVTDSSGRFALEDLPPGHYGVAVDVLDRALHHVEERTLEQDEDTAVIEVTHATVEGEVRSAASGEPLVAAWVTLSPADLAAAPRPPGSRAVSTNEEGRFRLGGFSPRRWQLEVSAEGYRSERREVLLAAGGRHHEVVELDGGSELMLTVTSDRGLPVDWPRLHAVPVAASGAAAARTPRVEPDPRQPGRFVVRDLDAGAWILYVSARDRAGARLAVSVPGSATAVLAVAGPLRIRIPALFADAGIARLRLFDAASVPWLGRQDATNLGREVRFGATTVDDLPPGTWQLEVTAADGRVFRASAQVVPGAVGDVALGD